MSLQFGSYLPLEIPSGQTDYTKEKLQLRVHLLKKMNVVDTRPLVEWIKEPKEGNEREKAKQYWYELLKEEKFQVDEIDRAELLTFHVLKGASENNSEMIKLVRHNLEFSLYYRESKPSDEWIQKTSCIDVEKFQKHALPRIRAKLALHELIIGLFPNEKSILRLLNYTPRYFKSRIVQETTRRVVWDVRHGKKEAKRKGQVFLKNMQTSLIGDLRKKKRTYPYWGLDHYFQELSACIRTYAKIREKGYLDTFCAYWGVPETYKNLIEENPRKFADHTLGVMVERGMIPEASTFRDVIAPYLKKMKMRYPYIRACHPVVENFLDVPFHFPQLMDKFDIWEHLENFDILSVEKFRTEHVTVPSVS